jgi:DNA-directed RNA polymerase subunit RPC12/RpoP
MSNQKVYKQHYACFKCRKAFKKTNLREAPKQHRHIDEKGRIVYCPECGERMPDVGFDFKVPKKNDVRAWEEAEAWLTGTLRHAIRNSSVVNTSSRTRVKKFIEEYDKKNKVRANAVIGKKQARKS